MTDQVPLDKAPPYDEEAERSLLGSMLMDHETCSLIVPTIRDKNFYIPDHQTIYDAMRQLYDEGKPIDFVIVHEQLVKTGHESIPADYLISLIESVPSSAHAEHYAQIVRDKGTLREIISACKNLLKECFTQQEDTEKLIDRAGAILLEISTDRSSGEAVSISDVLQETFDRIEALKRSEISGLRTGYQELDKMTSGFQNSELIIIAGRPSMGKTSLAMNIATHSAIHREVPTAIFSLEVNAAQLCMNMLCAEARVNAQDVRSGRLNEFVLKQLFDAAGRLGEAPIYIQDSPGLSITDLRAQCRRLKQQHNIGVVLVDYIQLMEGSRYGGYEGRQMEISTISRGLKSLARELDLPMIALSQLSRQVESREGNRPRMSDLRESGSLEQDADVILMLYREGYYKQDEEDKRNAEIIISKQRNGPTGTIELIFNREFLRFDNPTSEDIM